MADRTSLGFLGYICGAVTAAVMMMAVTLVLSHVDGRLSLEAAASESTLVVMR